MSECQKCTFFLGRRKTKLNVLEQQGTFLFFFFFETRFKMNWQNISIQFRSRFVQAGLNNLNGVSEIHVELIIHCGGDHLVRLFSFVCFSFFFSANICFFYGDISSVILIRYHHSVFDKKHCFFPGCQMSLLLANTFKSIFFLFFC